MMNKPTVGWWTLVVRSLAYFSRSHLTVAAGVAAATAVIVGALVVGDSVRGSLKGLISDRLGNIQSVLHSRTYFKPTLLDTSAEGYSIGPAILIPSASVETKREFQLLRSTQVQILGVDAAFWKHAPAIPNGQFPTELGTDEVAINAGLAVELKLKLNDEITIRFEKNAAVPADNPLGRRDDPPVSLPRQKVRAILPDDSIGGFSLRTTQSVPKNVFFGIASLQESLECGQTVNAAWVANSSRDLLSIDDVATLDEHLKPKIEDYGLQFTRHQLRYPQTETANKIYDYFQLSSTDLILDNDTVIAVSNVEPKPIRLIAYLANAIYKLTPDGQVDPSSREVPYSIVLGVDSGKELNLDHYTTLPKEDIREKPCWVNTWLAAQLKVKVGDSVQINYYEPETVDGREMETTTRAVVVGIVPIAEPTKERKGAATYTESPTIFNDRDFTPDVPGVTDQESINNWDTPFTMDRKVPKADDDYYARHGLTPKLFLRYDDASSLGLFGSRFGRATSLRFESAASIDEAKLRSDIEAALLTTKSQKGLTFQPLRYQQMKAASGTTPFDMLFLSLSFFVIVAALLLVSLLFRLSIHQRMQQVGLMMAQGFSSVSVRRLLVREMAIVTLLGSLAGVALGLLYARLMLTALQTWWVGAISVAFLKFDYSMQSLLIGAISGGLCSLLTIYWTVRKLANQPPLGLLRGNSGETATGARTINKAMMAISVVSMVAAVGLTFFGFSQNGMERAGCFFGSGMMLLTGGLIATREAFVARALLRPDPSQAGLGWLAWLAICRNPMRSVLSLGLLAVATFMIASMGLFQMAPTSRGYGGFDLLGESSQPIYRNLALQAFREEILGDKKAAELKSTTIVSLRARLRDDASCNNLFQSPEPTVLGVPKSLNELDLASSQDERFEWAGTSNPAEPWKALYELATGAPDSPIPVVLDQNTAAWSLHQGASLGAITKLTFNGQLTHFRTVGLLSNSVLQGKLLISEDNFTALFPKLSGFQFFMIRSGGKPAAVMESLESGWSDAGMDVVTSEQVLSRMLSVQNTYISAFQSLGALGLLLGTLGLAAVQTRSVMERRKELAMMRAVGFHNERIARMLMLETSILLGGGILVGIFAAGVAIVPHLVSAGTQTSVAQPLWMFAVILVTGFVSAIYAIRTAMKLPILSSLRAE
jgi:putative ABC transport system permease protein